MDDFALDTAAFRWREALDAATDSLDNVSRSREALRFSTSELRARMTQLEHERETTERALERLAGTTHTHLHRHLRTTENPQREPGFARSGFPARYRWRGAGSGRHSAHKGRVVKSLGRDGRRRR